GVPVVADRSVGLGLRLAVVGALVADADVALVGRARAAPWRSAARAVRARVVDRAEEPVVAGRSVGLRGVRAVAGGRIAGAGVVALIERRAGHGICPGADARLAGVRAGAGIAVVAGRPIRQVAVPAAGGWVAAVRRAGVAVVTGERWPTHAHAGGALIVRRAGVAVVAGAGDVRVHAADCGIAGVPGADVAVVAVGRRP